MVKITRFEDHSNSQLTEIIQNLPDVDMDVTYRIYGEIFKRLKSTFGEKAMDDYAVRLIAKCIEEKGMAEGFVTALGIKDIIREYVP